MKGQGALRSARPDWSWGEAAVAQYVKNTVIGDSRAGVGRRRPQLVRAVERRLEELRGQNCSVGASCTRLLAEVHAYHGSVHTAVDMFAGMPQADRGDLYGVLATAFARLNDLHAVSRIIAEEKKDTGHPSVASYNALLLYYATKGQSSHADTVLSDAKQSRVLLNQRSYKLWARSRRSYIEAMRCAPELAKMGVPPSMVHETVAMCCVWGGELDLAERLFSEHNVSKPHLWAWLMRGHADEGDMDEVLRIAGRGVVAADETAVLLLVCLLVCVQREPNPDAETNVYALLAETVFATLTQTSLRRKGTHTTIEILCAADLPLRAAAIADEATNDGMVLRASLHMRLSALLSQAGDVTHAARHLALASRREAYDPLAAASM